MSEVFRWQPRAACTGGHGTSPYEQNTQQSPDFGFNSVPQAGHCQKCWHALTGMAVRVATAHCGQVIVLSSCIVGTNGSICFILALDAELQPWAITRGVRAAGVGRLLPTSLHRPSFDGAKPRGRQRRLAGRTRSHTATTIITINPA